MKLRKQMLLILAFMAIVGTAGMWGFTNQAIEEGFEEIEIGILEGTIIWGVDDIIDLSVLMDSAAAPIAAWDDMYQYMETHDSGFIEGVFSDSVFTRNEFNLVLIYDNSGQLIYGKYYDYKAGVERQLPTIFTETATVEALINYNLEESDTLGLITLNNSSLIVASRPILDNSETMPKRGTLVLGLDFSYDYVELIQELTDLPLEYYTLDNPTVPADVKTRLTLDTPFTYDTKKTSIRGYYLIPDLFGEPGLIVSIEQSREVYLEGQQVRREFLSVIIGLGFLLGSLAIVYADRTILRTVIRLTDEVANITKVDDLSARVQEYKGDNEISELTREVNKMLEQLEESRTNEIRQHEALEKMREESTREIFEAAKKISYLVHNDLERPIRSMKQVAYSLREENNTELADILETSIKYNEATLLELAALANLGEPKRTVSDLNEVVDAAIANIEPKVGVDIIAETGDEFLAINIDALKIIRAVENVVRNAVEAIDSRGEVHVSVTNDDKTATVTVKDNGKGVQPKDVELIFEPFYSTKDDAMGLGLPYAKQVIEAHNGTISIATGENGTTVTISIPLKQSNEQ